MNETRFNSNCHLRADFGASSRKVAGMAVPYGGLSEPIGNGRDAFREKMTANTFDGDGLARNIYSLWNHDSSQPLGSTGNYTLKLDSRDDGLHFVLSIAETSVGDEVLENIRSGLVNGISIGFQATADSWAEGGSADDGLPIRIVKRATLLELSPCVWPAYTQTSVEAARALRARREQSLGVNAAALRRRRLRLAEYGAAT